MKLLPGDHEGGQIGRVNGQENQSEHRPDTSHNSEIQKQVKPFGIRS